jgi:uncharacterized protein (TIGR00730 family)
MSENQVGRSGHTARSATAPSRSRVRRVGLVGGTATTVRAPYRELAQQLGAGLGRAGVSLVYGGAALGVTGTVLSSAATHGSHVTNVVPHRALCQSASVAWKRELYVVRTVGDGRRLVHRLVDGFVVLPGGLDTFDALGELAVIERSAGAAKPIVVVNLCGYFDALLTLLDRAVSESFVTLVERRLFEVADTVDDVLSLLGVATDDITADGVTAPLSC